MAETSIRLDQIGASFLQQQVFLFSHIYLLSTATSVSESGPAFWAKFGKIINIQKNTQNLLTEIDGFRLNLAEKWNLVLQKIQKNTPENVEKYSGKC